MPDQPETVVAEVPAEDNVDAPVKEAVKEVAEVVADLPANGDAEEAPATE